MSTRLDVRLNWPQTVIQQQLGPKRTITLPWGRGVGKSWFDRLIFYLLVAEWDRKRLPDAPKNGIRWIWLMDTLKHFKDVHAQHLLHDLVDGEWAWLGARINRSTWEITFPGGSWCKPFPALEHTAKSGLGQRCDVACVDECDDVPTNVYHTVVGPWFTEPWSYRLRILSGTPRHGRYGLLYEMHQRGLSKDPKHAAYHSLHATYRDCPETVDPDVVEEARANTPPAIFGREWECRFDTAEGLVYGLYDESFHDIDLALPRFQALREVLAGNRRFTDVLVGVDWGYSDPGVFLVFGVLGQGDDAICYLIEEHYEREKTLDWWVDRARLIRERFPGARWWADPSQPGNIETLKSKAGVNIRPHHGKIADGVARVATMLMIRGQPPKAGEPDHRWARLYIHRKCVQTRWELRNYKRRPDPSNRDQYTDEIVGKNDHAMDAGRYCLFGAFGSPPRVRDEWTGSQFG